MAGYRPPLHEGQIELLRWVADGCPDGRYSGHGHRGSARTLEARGLLRIKGRGATWSAETTPAGDHYLEHGSYPPGPKPASGSRGPSEAPRVSPVRRVAVPKPPKPKAGAPYVRKTDLMMEALLASPDKRLVIEPEERESYTRLVSIAKRKGLVPDGMSLEITGWVRRSEEAAVWLEPLPEWRTRALEPVTVSRRLASPTDVVVSLDARADIEFDPKVRSRAMRILDALVREARSRHYKVRAGRAPVVARPVRRNEYVDPDRLGQLRLQIGDDVFRLCLSQVLIQVKHVATRAELARSGRGWGPPSEFDEVPSEELQLVVHGDGAAHWGSRWADREGAPLEVQLAQVLQEAELRHQAQEEVRAERARKQQREQREWEQARDRAAERFRADHRIHVLLDQVRQHRLVAEIRDYAAAVRVAADGYANLADQDAARAWASWASAYADSIDPFREPVREATSPEPSAEALASYMYPLSPHGPGERLPHAFGFAEQATPERRSWWQDRSVPPWRR